MLTKKNGGNTVKAVEAIDMNELKHYGEFAPGFLAPCFLAGVLVRFWREGELMLEFDKELRQKVRFTWTPCPWEGRRMWFLCPDCGRRVRKLYRAGTRFKCRHCRHLGYGSQMVNKSDRPRVRAERIRRRLGGPAGLVDPSNGRAFPYPGKPKGMHWVTYWRLRNKGEELEEQDWAETLQRFERIFRRHPANLPIDL